TQGEVAGTAAHPAGAEGAAMTRARMNGLCMAGAGLLWCVAVSTPAQAQGQPRDDVVARAMRDEMARTMTDLRIEKAGRPRAGTRFSPLRAPSANSRFKTRTSSAWPA